MTTLFVPVAVATAGGLAAPVAFGQNPDAAELTRERTATLASGQPVWAAGEPLMARGALPAVYRRSEFEPLWLDDLDAIAALVAEVRRSSEHGFRPEEYHLDAIERLAERHTLGKLTARDSVDLELLSSDAFLMLGSHLLHGRVNPETIDPEWIANRRGAELDLILEKARTSGSVSESLRGLAPRQDRYATLVAERARLLEVQERGGWTTVDAGPTLRLGDESSRVTDLRARLGVESGATPELFDDAVREAVLTFQRTRGLDADGAVGPATLEALNLQPGQLAETIALNLERWRWLPAELGRRHIEVNIAGFDVKVVENGSTVQTHRAIVGRFYRQTPMFTGSMTYLVFAPYWHVPPTIARVDKFPAIQADPNEIARQRMTLLDAQSNAPVDPSTVGWADLTGNDFVRRYRLRQDPGPHNALGSVKFMFPNRHNVYLHDTPTRQLFERTARNFSSGCIRVENPLELARYLLSDVDGWTEERIDRASRGESETTVRLSSAVPVHLLYWTATIDDGGNVRYHPDLYGRDAVVREALARPTPAR